MADETIKLVQLYNTDGAVYPVTVPKAVSGLNNYDLNWHYTVTDDGKGNMELRTTNCSEGSVRCWYNDVFAVFSINVKSANSWTNGTYYTVAILAQQFIDLIGHTYMDGFTGIISNGYPCQILLNTWETGDRLQVKPLAASPASGTWYIATFIVPITK